MSKPADKRFAVEPNGRKFDVVRYGLSPRGYRVVIFRGRTEKAADAWLVKYLAMPIEERRKVREFQA
jgi:hypothetical protein